MPKECLPCEEDLATEPISFMPECPLYGEAYTPYQQSNEMHCLEDALARGTLFPSLERPYMADFC